MVNTVIIYSIFNIFHLCTKINAVDKLMVHAKMNGSPERDINEDEPVNENDLILCNFFFNGKSKLSIRE